MMEDLNLREDQFGSYYSDLYVLPDNDHQLDEIIGFAKQEGCTSVLRTYSDVEGQPWYGKQFVEIAFAYPEYYEERVKTLGGTK